MNMNALLKNKTVLNIVFILAILNLFGYLLVDNHLAVGLYIIIGFVGSLFTKNMIIVLTSTMLITNFIIGSKFTINEGLENKKKEHKEKKSKEGLSNYTKNEDTDLKGSKIDYASTLESAYDSLDDLLGSEAIKNMGDDTKRLANKQKVLMENMKKLEPMMNKAHDVLDKIDTDKIGGMIEGLSSKLTDFGIVGK